jgi:hypothetical protein
MDPLPEPANIDAEPTPGFFDPPGTELHLEKWRAQIDYRLEIMARAVIRGRLKTSRDIRRIAEKLKVKPELVKLWITDPQVLKKAAVYATALALPHQAEKAKEDIQAFKAVANIAGLIESGPRSQVNVAIDNRTRGDTTSDRKFFEQYARRVERLNAPVSDVEAHD